MSSEKHEPKRLYTNEVSSIFDLKSELIKKKSEVIKSSLGSEYRAGKKGVLAVKKEEKVVMKNEALERKRRINEHEIALRQEEEDRLLKVAKKMQVKQRVYGVSHMKFSTNEEKRQEEMQSLIDMSKKTEQNRAKQRSINEMREQAKKDKMARLRQRLGLPEPKETPRITEPTYLDIPLPEEDKPKKMPPLERSPTPNLPWNQLVAHARQLRAEMRSSLALPFSRMSLVKTRNGCRLYALGTPASSSNQTLLAAEISTDLTSPILLQPLFNPDQFKTATPSHEFSLMCERQRSSVVSGVTDYAIDTKTNTLLLTTGEQVFRFSDGNVRPVAGINSFSTSGGSSFVFDTQFCPSEPKLVSYVLNKQVVDSGLKIPLTKRFPWIEYIARAGFLNDGKTIWVQAMERLQCRSSLILIPESDFEGFEVTGPIREATIIRDDFADPQGQCAWINAHNIIVPLDVAGSDVVQFIYASECVASYSSKEPYSRMLTEQGLSYRGERAHHRLSLLPDVGFASWMTSLSQPPHCRFYGLIFDSACLLPDARLLAQQVFIILLSGRSHSALVLRPSNYESGKCYPVLHYVYGGPGIQIVRNDYCADLNIYQLQQK
uniref:CNH domain-containing protein n=1 Tax=Heterorhabditis bacteriophora TaxID=37862 RepID=A0A1I7WS52_HETBA